MYNSIKLTDLQEFINSLESLVNKVSQLDEASKTEENNNRFLTTEEAADFLGVSKRTMYNYRQYRSGLPYHQIGRRILYKEEDLLIFAAKYRIDNGMEERS